MLVRRRSVRLSATVQRRTVEWAVPGTLVQLVEARGCRFDTRDLGPPQRIGGDEAVLTVPLSGVCITGPDRSIEATPRTVALSRHRVWDERWEGRDPTFLTIVFAPDRSMAVDVVEVGPRLTGLAHRLASAMREGSVEREPLEQVLAALQAEGLPVPSVPRQHPPRQALRLQRALDEWLARLHEQPQWSDLEQELGLTERQLRRWWKQQSAWLSGTSLRQRLNQVRCVYAASLLTAPGTSSSEVAAALGYRSARALNTALRRRRAR